MERNEAFAALQTNLTDMIQESQIKVGYTGGSMGIYYPLATLNRMFDMTLTATEMEAFLQGFGKFTKDTLGEADCSRDGERFCLRVPPAGAAYVHEKGEKSGFLREFINCIRGGACTIEDILAVFSRYSEHVVCRKMEDDEVDYLVYFEDGVPDSYRYCIKFEFGEASYHRFTPKDFDSFGF